MTAYNLLRAATEAGDSKGGGVFIEEPGAIENIRWQTRAQPLSAHEDVLADALMAVFGDGIWELGPCVDALNARGVLSPEGVAWTSARFTEHLVGLAAPADLHSPNR